MEKEKITPNEGEIITAAKAEAAKIGISNIADIESLINGVKSMLKVKEDECTNERIAELEDTEEISSAWNDARFSITSKIYSKDFRSVTFIIFDSKAGKLRKEVFSNKIEGNENRKIIKETAMNVKDEILRLRYKYIENISQVTWNRAITNAAECCNCY